MKKMNEGFEMEMMSLPTSKVIVNTIPVREIIIFIDEPIGEPSDYREEIEALDSALPHDNVRILLTTPGGRLDTALLLCNAIEQCEAEVTGCMVDEVASAGTAIALACDNWELGDMTYFMIHSASHGAVGKDHEVKSQMKFMEKHLDKFLKKVYTGFLTPKEISAVADGKDMWIDGDDLRSRLKNYAEYRQKKIEEMMSEVVDKGEE